MSIRIAILASGSGTNAQAIFDKIDEGVLDVKVCVVLCNRPGAKVIERAKRRNISTVELDHTAYPDRESFDQVLVEAIKKSDVDLIVLAGYMRVLSSVFLKEFAGKVINIHPAILPSFKGAHGARDACAFGVKVSGCTVHFVDEEVDHGAVIAQAVVPVETEDDEFSLQRKIQRLEYRVYPQVLQWFAEDRIQVNERHIKLLPAKIKQEKISDCGEDIYFAWPPLEKGF